jgi:hypothetical protein
MRKLTIVALAILALACYDRHGGRGRSVGSAWLETVCLRYRIPAVHLLYVADVGSPGARGGWGGAGTYAPWKAELHLNYTDFSTRARVEAHPVLIQGTTLRADGQSFDLTRGNVLVVHLSPSGSLSVTQLLERRGADEPAKNIVSTIKGALPRDARVQALPLS